MKGKNLKPQIFYSAKLSLGFDGEVKHFADKQKLKELGTTKTALQKMLKGLL